MVERRAVARADGIITVCQENTERLVREYGFPPEKNAIVHNTPVHLFSDEEIPPAPPPNRIFGYHGFVTAERNLELFVEGFALALEDLRAKHVEHPETPTLLHIAGHGETLADVQRTSKRLGIEENVVLLGAYSHSTLPGLYAQTHFGIVPSVDSAFINHTIANKVFDYMACGRPVLVSNVRPMRRVIEETGAGVVADCTRSTSIADAIIGMRMMSQEQYHAMAKAGKNAIATKYNWQTDTQTMLDFLERFIK
jgi:glycosyltransferase involved in cell wall biosynthesis